MEGKGNGHEIKKNHGAEESEGTGRKGKRSNAQEWEGKERKGKERE